MIVLIVLAVIAVAIISLYNRLVRLRNQGDESWSGIDVQLKRRYDLIPNIVETVKGYAKHEQQTFENVIKARNSAMSTSGVADKAQAENLLSGALKSVFALAEAYPELKANTNFLDLQKSLTEVEDNLQLARRYYNAVVRDLNTACESFPSVIVANMFGFSKRSYFEIAESEKANVKVQF